MVEAARKSAQAESKQNTVSVTQQFERNCNFQQRMWAMWIKNYCGSGNLQIKLISKIQVVNKSVKSLNKKLEGFIIAWVEE